MQKNIHQNTLYIMRIIFCLIPIALVTGPFLSDLIVSVIALFYLSKHYKFWEGKYKIYIILFLTYNLYLILLSIFSIDPFTSLESSLFYFRYLFFSLGVVYLIDLDNKAVIYFRRVLFVTILIVMFDAYYQLLNGRNILGYGYLTDAATRFAGFFGPELVLGRYLAYLMPLAFALLSIKKNLKTYEMVIALLFLVAADVLVFLTGERSAFLLLTISTLIIITCIKRFKILRLITFILSSLIIIIITLNVPLVKERNIDFTISQLGMNEGKVNAFSAEHERYYKTSIAMFIDSPIFGHGTKMYRVLCNEDKYKIHGNACNTHPHNTYLQLLAETGLVGTLPVVFVLLIIVFKLIMHLYSVFTAPNNRYLNDFQVCLLAGMFISLWPLAPTLNFFNNWICILYFICVPFYFIDSNKYYEKK